MTLHFLRSADAVRYPAGITFTMKWTHQDMLDVSLVTLAGPSRFSLSRLQSKLVSEVRQRQRRAGGQWTFRGPIAVAQGKILFDTLFKPQGV